jgi:dethiobiotin synthetase
MDTTMVEEKKQKIYFVTGTDTHVGKTTVSTLLLKKWQEEGFSTLALKPIASGAIVHETKKISEDAFLLHACMTEKLPLEVMNPLLIDEPVGPSVYCLENKSRIDIEFLVNHCKKLLEKKVDRILIEGVGGWCAPIDQSTLMPDLVRHLCNDVVLVVGLKLGCINHAILSARAIQSNGFHLVGWVANHVDESLLFPQSVIESIQLEFTALQQMKFLI